MEVHAPIQADESLISGMNDFRGSIGFIKPETDDPEIEIDPAILLGQVEALWRILAGISMVLWTTPEDQERNARKIEEALLNPDSLGPLERQYGPEFITGYREIVVKVSRLLRGK